VRAGVEPCGAAAEDLDVEVLAAQVLDVEVGDL
jgi:hypothetical protein